MYFSNKRIWLLIVLIVSTLLLLVSATAVLADDPVRINPFYDTYVEVQSGETVEILWGWVNCGRGLANPWVNATEQHYTLYKEGLLYLEISSEKAEEYWGVPWEGGPAELCFIPQNTWVVLWTYNLGQLETGTYELACYKATTHKLTDGFDSDQDGRIDFFEPHIWVDKTITIEVVE